MDPAKAHHKRVTIYVWQDNNRGMLGSFDGIGTWDGKELLVVHDPDKPFPLRFPKADRPFPYLVAICDALSKTLAHAAGLRAEVLCGYAANFDFWWEEVRHALRVLDGYNDRFGTFESAQLRFAETRGYQELPEIERSVATEDRRAARRDLVEAWTKFAKRCDKEQFVDTGKVKAAAASVQP